jgi:hypothetical protein
LLCLSLKKRSKTISEMSEKSLKNLSVEYNRIIDAVKAYLTKAMLPGEGEEFRNIATVEIKLIWKLNLSAQN